MSENNGNSKWTMWAMGLMLTVGIAANGMTVNWVNAKFTAHANRPHKDTVSKDRFNDIHQELKGIKKELLGLERLVVRLDERLKNLKEK